MRDLPSNDVSVKPVVLDNESLTAVLSDSLSVLAQLLEKSDTNREWSGKTTKATEAFCSGSIICGSGIWWCSTPKFLLTSVVLVTAWMLLFYIAAFLLFPLIRSVRERSPSRYENEESRYWFANHVASTVHAITITAMVVPTWFALLIAPTAVQFSQPSVEGLPWFQHVAMAGNAAHIFLCYIICDFIVGFVHALHQQGNAFHHMVFILFALLVMYNCFLAFVAVTLLLMEASTIFLNYFTFWRNRLGYSDTSVQLAMYMFGLVFFIARIVCLFGIVLYFGKLILFRQLHFAGIPMWQIMLIFLGLIVAFGLQLFWFHGIMEKALGLSSRIDQAPANATEERRVDTLSIFEGPLVPTCPPKTAT